MREANLHKRQNSQLGKWEGQGLNPELSKIKDLITIFLCFSEIQDFLEGIFHHYCASFYQKHTLSGMAFLSVFRLRPASLTKQQSKKSWLGQCCGVVNKATACNASNPYRCLFKSCLLQFQFGKATENGPIIGALASPMGILKAPDSWLQPSPTLAIPII